MVGEEEGKGSAGRISHVWCGEGGSGRRKEPKNDGGLGLGLESWEFGNGSRVKLLADFYSADMQ